jgi:hypothetical protein
MSRKQAVGENGGDDLSNSASKLARHDTWDEPEFDEFETPKRKMEEEQSSEGSSSKKPKTETVKEITETSNSNSGKATTDAPLVADTAVIIVAGADAPENASTTGRKRRSFCNFHYRTTQGGSSSVEPGDDPAMQSPETNTRALRLVEFQHDDLDVPPMG